MNSLLQDSPIARQPGFASAGTSVLVHAAVVGCLLLISGPVWKAIPRRAVTTLVAPARLAPLAMVRPKLRRASAMSSAVASPMLPPALRRVTSVQSSTRAALRIESPLENAPVSVPVPVSVPLPPLPTLSLPVLPMKPSVQVGLLDTPSAMATPARTAGGMAGFDSGMAGKSEGRRRIARSGFDEGPSGSAVPGRRALSSGGFDQIEAPAARLTVAKVVTTPFEGIEILEKPRPVYTDEARRLRIEGTVQLRVVFGAAGQIRVVAVVKGLGHGLDEAAVQAAEAIRFRPARRDGRPVDAPAVIQIQFQIA